MITILVFLLVLGTAVIVARISILVLLKFNLYKEHTYIFIAAFIVSVIIVGVITLVKAILLHNLE